jgi:hypothetical protein
MTDNSYPCHQTLEDLKAALDCQLGRVGKIDRENNRVVYEAPEYRPPATFCSYYEVVEGKHRLTGRIRIRQLRRRASSHR